MHIYCVCILTLPTVSEAIMGICHQKFLTDHPTGQESALMGGIITVLSNHLAFLPGTYVPVPFVRTETCCSGISTGTLISS